ncbi:MAG: hypothetical protein NVS3B12_14020 [Acidimicrobiales bacterium]
MRSGRGVVPGVAMAAASITAVELSYAVASGRPVLGSRWHLLTLLGAWALAWVVSARAAFGLPRRVAVWAIVAVAIAVRLAALGGPPVSSDDLYRYAWDGRVQMAGTDPYAHPPESPALAHLREGWLWPDARGCSRIDGRPPGCTRLNRPSVRTIYPPVAEAWFSAVYRLGGVGGRHKTWQLAGLGTDLVVIGLLAVGLQRAGRDPRWLGVYALCPAPAYELVNNAHVDGLAIALVLGALVVCLGPSGEVDAALPGAPHRGRVAAWRSVAWRSEGWRSEGWRAIVAGALIGAAVSVKVYPAVVLPAMVGLGSSRRVGVLLRSAGPALAVVVAGYVPHVASVGAKVVGYLPGYLKEEHYNSGGRFLIASAGGLPERLGGPVSAALVVAMTLWVLWRRPPVVVGATVLLGSLLLAVTPVQPWYAVMLVALACLAARPEWIAVSLAGLPYYLGVILDYPHVRGLGQALYVAALGVVVAGGAVRRAQRVGSMSSSTDAEVPVTIT